MIEQILATQPVDALDVAAALTSLLQGKKPLFIDEKADARMQLRSNDRGDRKRPERAERGDRKRGERNTRGADRGAPKAAPSSRPMPLKSHPDVEMARFVRSEEHTS